MTQPADETQFAFESAARIARVVRTVENAVPRGTPLEFNPVIATQSRVLRLGYYSGSWGVNESKVVTINQSDRTLTAENVTYYLPVAGTYTARDCIVGKIKGKWYLVQAKEDNVKRGTFTPPWNKNTQKTVTLASGGTVQADNRHADLIGTGTKSCTVARDGMQWEVIAAEC